MLLVLDITNKYVKSYKYFCASEETEKQSIIDYIRNQFIIVY